MTDFRALCAELVDYWENDCPVTLAEVMERARAALAEPEPSSLKEQALEILDRTPKGWGLAEVDLDTIRRALEQLDD